MPRKRRTKRECKATIEAQNGSSLSAPEYGSSLSAPEYCAKHKTGLTASSPQLSLHYQGVVIYICLSLAEKIVEQADDIKTITHTRRKKRAEKIADDISVSVLSMIWLMKISSATAASIRRIKEAVK